MSTVLEGRTTDSKEGWDGAENARLIRKRMERGRRGLTVSGLIEKTRKGSRERWRAEAKL